MENEVALITLLPDIQTLNESHEIFQKFREAWRGKCMKIHPAFNARIPASLSTA